MNKGRFIVLEGPDGAGTTLHTRLLCERLIAEGKDVLQTNEPTSGPIGTWIRSELKRGELSSEALQLLFCADRADHVRKVLDPALAAGKIVVSDRYALSTLAYGSIGDLDTQWLKHVNAVFPKPDLTILTLPPLDICLERLGRRQVHDVFEKREVQEMIHAAYRKLTEEDPSIQIVDTSGEKIETAAKIYSIVYQKIMP